MTLKRTPCCALLFMTAKNNDDINVIHKKLKKKQNQLDQVTWHGYGKGETTVQCIVLPTETKLRKNLIKIGFKKKVIFERRKVSCLTTSVTSLSMYVLNLKNLKELEL